MSGYKVRQVEKILKITQQGEKISTETSIISDIFNNSCMILNVLALNSNMLVIRFLCHLAGISCL